MDRMLSRIARRYLMRYIGKGINAGIEEVARRRNGGQTPADLHPDQRAQVARNQKTARQAMRVARRFGRF